MATVERAVAEAAADALLARGESLEPRMTPYVPWQPTPKQAAFLSPPVTMIRDVFYGGAAGGAKSVALLMAALQYVDVPGYAAVVVRKNFPMLSQEKGLIPLAHAWLDETDAYYRYGLHQWVFPSGATMSFRHLENEEALRQYQGGEYHFIGVDEVTDFSESQFTFLFSRQRREAGFDIPLRVRCTSNPIGPGRDWVYTRYVLARTPGRLFIPARLEDNPHLDQESYDESLRQSGEVLYQQLRFGNWEIRAEGTMFKRGHFEIVLPSAVPDDVVHVRYWDLAATETPKSTAARRMEDADYTAGLLLARSPDGTYFVDDVQRARRSPQGVEQLVRETAEADGTDVPIRMEQEGGASGKSLVSHYRRNVLDGFDFKGIPSSGSKETRAAPVAARVEAGEVKLVRGSWIDAFLNELTEFPGGLHDDQVDALSGAYGYLAGAVRAPVPPPSGTVGSSYWRGA